MDQAFPVLAPDGDGGAIVAWQEFGRIFAQRMARSGDVFPGWPAARGLEVCPLAPQGPFHQCAPRIASDEAGGAFILWHDGRSFGCSQYCFDEGRELYLQHIMSNGAIDSRWPELGLQVGSSFGEMLFTNGTGRLKPTSFNSSMIPDGTGGVIIAWEGMPPLSGDSVATIRAQRVSAGGRLLWGSRGSLACIAVGGHWYPVLSSDGDGGAFVVWEEHPVNAGPVQIWGQHLTASGRPLLRVSGVPLIDGVAGNADHQISSNAGREAFIVWSASMAGRTSVYARGLSARIHQLRRLDRMLADNASPQPQPQVSVDSRGAWFAWLGPTDGGYQAVFLRQMAGHPELIFRSVSPTTSIGGSVTARKSTPRLAPDGRGGAFVAWMEGSFAPRAIHVLPRGAIDRSWPPAGAHVDDPLAGSYQLELTTDEANGAIMAWQRRRELPSADDMVLLQRLRENGVGDGGGRRTVSDNSALKPGSGAFLWGFTPNPIFDAVEAAITLPEAGPAVLELFDSSGRRLSTQQVGNLGPGRHLVRLSARGVLPPGVYFVRLSRANEVLTARGVVIR